MLKVWLKRIVLVILACLGYIILLPLWKKKGIRVIRYHSVNDFRKHEVNVKIKAFREQIEYLANTYNVISLDEFLKKLSDKEMFDNLVMISFDDGYHDNFINAYPVLRKHNFPAVIFLSAGYINTNRILPHDKKDSSQYNRLLNWKEVREMADNDINFGSHTLHHVNLGKSSFKKIENEIKESKNLIEENIDSEVKTISYPFGLSSDFDNRVVEVTKRAGYLCGFSAMYGVNTKKTDRYRFYRIGIESSDTMFTFKAKLNGALDVLMLIERPVVRRMISRINKVLECGKEEVAKGY